MKCEYGCEKEAKYQFKNGRWCCSKFSSSCPHQRLLNSKRKKENYRFTVRSNSIKKECKHCNKKIASCSLKRHEEWCYLNPKNLKTCPVCGKPIKNYKTSVTCGYSCSNTYFRSGSDNPNWKGTNGKRPETSYRRICFNFTDKKCIICGEDKIIHIHHLDGDKNNNDVKNLIPLCPTHHAYCHSKYFYLIEDEIKKFSKIRV